MQRICCCVEIFFHAIKEQSKEVIQALDAPCKDGLNDVAIRCNEWEQATEKAHTLLEHSHRIVQTLYRDLWQTTLHIVGVTTCSSTTAGAVYIVMTQVPLYSDPVSPYYIAEPIGITVLVWLLSSYVVSGCMNLWDHTSDSLLYCYVWHRRWSRKTVDKHIPDSLRHIVGFDDTEHDRYPYYGKAKNNMYLRFWLPMFGLGGKHGHHESGEHVARY